MLGNIAGFAFMTMAASFLIWAIFHRFQKRIAEVAFLVAAGSFGVVMLIVVCGIYSEGQIKPVPAGRVFKRSVFRESEPILFHVVLGGIGLLALALSAILPVGMLRVIQSLLAWRRRRQRVKGKMDGKAGS